MEIIESFHLISEKLYTVGKGFQKVRTLHSKQSKVVEVPI